MKRVMNLLLVAAIVWGARGAAAEVNRVGTFDRVSIVVAYYRSSLWDDAVRKMHVELAKAKKAKDMERTRELTSLEKSSRVWAHNQLEKGESIRNVLEALKPAVEKVKKDDNLSDIVVAPAADSKAETVDVTEKLLTWLKADDDTRKVIADYKKK